MISAPANEQTPPDQDALTKTRQALAAQRSKEIGGPSGLEPTRYGDWERKGICVDF